MGIRLEHTILGSSCRQIRGGTHKQHTSKHILRLQCYSKATVMWNKKYEGSLFMSCFNNERCKYNGLILSECVVSGHMYCGYVSLVAYINCEGN